MPRPRKNPLPPEESSSTEESPNVEIAPDELGSLKERQIFVEEELKKMSSELKTLVVSVEEIKKQGKETQPQDVLHETVESDNEIANTILQILGSGWTYKIEPSSPGVSFKLILTPPEHLKVSPKDSRIKVITNAEGISGIKQYCELVKGYSIRWAQQNGINFQT